ncbi:amino acid/amide ABC transporter membrane protein 2, HAAT family [Halovenus aranensis]|uniref:Amino acid/amide ABC transporter membrane protein 2, HAAT family n=1 Tax=Halovenus aranensis TaxID=890420 RepID=A0A1G8RW38_9EURY|nr:branched-chain amino acid ABC transporter permease [Halovenus aranensis]SDJ21146.1 amino acid/amide ABC transporter membrane protein 2, HAAT family [Halovenus aranensis]
MPCGEYFTSYEERMGLIRWRIERVALVLGLPIPLIAPFVLTGELVSVFTLVFIFGIAVLGLHVMLSYAGEIVLAQGAFMAIGAYTASRIVNEAGLGLLPAMLIAGLMTASVATAFGLPAGRVKGFYVAISTLALQFIAVQFFFRRGEFEAIHGGTQQSMPGEIGLVGDALAIGSANEEYFFALLMLVVFALLTMNLSRTGIARMFRALHENDLSAQVLGVNRFRNKLLAYAIGGFMVGVAGALYTIYIGFITPEFFSIDITLLHYMMLLLGGMGRVWGVILGVTTVELLNHYILQTLIDIFPEGTSLEPMFFGVIIIVVLIVEPKGLMAALGQLKEYLRKWPYAY